MPLVHGGGSSVSISCHPGKGNGSLIGIYCGLNFRLALSGHKDRGSKYHGASFTALTVCYSTIKPCFKHVKGF